MMKSGKRYTFFMLLATLALASCEKEEKPYTLPPPGPARVDRVGMGSDYSKVIFYRMSDGQSFLKDLSDWQIALECGDSGKFIYINGGTGIQTWNTGSSDFTAKPDVSKAAWQWDSPSGNRDSTAIGAWMDSSGGSRMSVYVVDRGKKAAPQYKKIQVLEVNAASYKIRTADLDGSNDKTYTITKDADRNFVYASLDNGQVLNFEPAKDDWDIIFTRYRFVYYDMTPITPYEVNGALLNPNKVQVAMENNTPFADITRDSISKYTFSSRRDFIGFDWKIYDFNTSSYVTNLKRTYIIKSHDGIYYKLRFIDFYDDQGVKGAPSFEVQAL